MKRTTCSIRAASSERLTWENRTASGSVLTIEIRRGARYTATALIVRTWETYFVHIVCLDLEGVLVPEVWINFAERTGIPELRLTTRDIPDYDQLMQGRLRILAEHKLGLAQIQEVISSMDPLPGAHEFLERLRQDFQVIILSDTFYEFGMPLMAKLGYPSLFCHRLEVGADGAITGYQLRQPDPKRRAVAAFKSLNLRVLAAGDSFNDTSMLAEADAGIFFCVPENVAAQFPQFPQTRTYAELAAKIRQLSVGLAQ
jgi:phosphoserine/homoserine phosphotransferase